MSELLDRAIIFTVLAVLVSFLRYGSYIHSIFQRQTRPHIFSFINWSLIIGIGAYAQFTLGGGYSAYLLGLVSAVCAFIAFLSIFYGERNITRSDWLAFIAALVLVPIWMLTRDALVTLLLIIVIDCLTFYPTIRKTYIDPSSEPPLSYFWAGLRYLCVLMAVPAFNFDTMVYPVFLMLTEWGFMAFILWRRHVLKLLCS